MVQFSRDAMETPEAFEQIKAEIKAHGFRDENGNLLLPPNASEADVLKAAKTAID